MKIKTILLAAAALGLAVTTGFAQGTISFQTAVTTGPYVTTNVNGTTGKANSATGGRVELLYQPDTGGSAPSTAGLTSFGSVTLGNWEVLPTIAAAGSPTAGNIALTGETTGNDVAAGGNVWLTSIGWSGGYATLAAAQAANAAGEMYGSASPVWSQATGGGSLAPVSTSPFFTGLVLTPTPEPATIALGGLGAAALLLFRRRK